MYAAKGVILALAISLVNCFPDHWSSPNLNPVHGLYVKPSEDGATGDLYVAATEDNGVKSQWVVDKPINFLPLAAATNSHAATFSIFPTPIDESSTKKRAVMPSAVPSSPVQYTYALPIPTNEGNSMSLPYAYTTPPSLPENLATKCDPKSPGPHYPYQYPLQLFYPQMMSAYSNAMSILKDAGVNEDTASSLMAQPSPMWPPSPYPYPMYVMVDPSAWAQISSATPSTSTSSPSEEESDQN